jgi:GTP pyrophosphokinase
VVNKLRASVPEAPHDTLAVTGRPHPEAKPSISLDGADRVMIRRARCCQPIPGDEVIGYVTRGKGMMIHRQTCPNVAAYRTSDPRRLVEVEWKESDGERYPADIVIQALDRVGLLNDISAIFSEERTNISSAHSLSRADRTAKLELTVDVEGVGHLNKLIQHVGRLNDVLGVERVTATVRKKKA